MTSTKPNDDDRHCRRLAELRQALEKWQPVGERMLAEWQPVAKRLLAEAARRLEGGPRE